MSFIKKFKDLFKKDLKAFIKSEKSEVPSEFEKEEDRMYFTGAWEEEGKTRWGFFETKEDKLENINNCNIIQNKVLEIGKDSSGQTVEDFERNLFSKTDENALTESPPVKTGKKVKRVFREKKKIKVFFAEDNRIFQTLIKSIIEKSEDMELTDWASDGLKAVEKIKKLKEKPDVILMDIAMPGLDGISAAEKILQDKPGLKVIMLTSFGDKDSIVNAFAAGACGYLRKDGGLILIRDAIKQVATGNPPPIQDEVALYLMESVDETSSSEQ